MSDPTLELLLRDEEAYFAEHLDGDYWRAQNTARRRAALATAALDLAVLLHRKTIDSGELLQRAAVYEQAIHLCRRADEVPAVLSETVDGVGSRTYAAPERPSGEYAPRALRLLQVWLAPRPVNLSRG